MFVKKLVEKASIKKPGGNSDALKACEVAPRLVFHHGVLCNGTKLAYDNIQKILAISTKDGRIKLYGRDNTQALLESSKPVPSKFLQFIQNQGILLNINFDNHIEVWDIDKKLLVDEHIVKKEITSFAVIQHSLFLYIGDSVGNITVLKLEQTPWHLVQMKYTIPLSASFGNPTDVSDDTVATHILPQPAAESKRVLIIFKNGRIILWDIRESKSIFRTGGNMSPPLNNEAKKVTSACWACPLGTKVVLGYSNGEIFIWNIPSLKVDSTSDYSSQNTPMFKLNLGYKSDKTSIGTLKWIYADGKASRLYVIGASDSISNLVQVVLFNEHIESRTIKLGLLSTECCIDMEIISSSSEQSKHKQDSLLLLGKSGHVYTYDDCQIEKYLLQCQSRSTLSLPKEVTVKLPLADSIVTTAKFFSANPCLVNYEDAACKDYVQLLKNYPPVIPIETKQKDGTNLSSANFTGFSKIRNLYITGHSNGAVTFWDASSPFFVPVLHIRQQSEHDFSLSGVAVTALHFDGNYHLLVSGDQSGMVRIFKFKPEPYATNSFMSLTGNTKIIQSVKVVKTNGAVLSISTDHSGKRLAVGSDQGYVSLIDVEDATLLYQEHIASEICTGIISLLFQTCSLHGFEKNILAVGTKDSSVLALDSETGNTLSNGSVHPKKPSKALFMQVLDGQGEPMKDGLDLSKGIIEDVTSKQLSMLLCSEKALYVYSLEHVVQGVKKVLYKKKYQSSCCCWASTFYGPSNAGLILVFTSGKMEIRSLPDLSLIVETSIRGFSYSPPKSKAFSDIQICCSSGGDIVLVNGDQEIYLITVLAQRNIYRLLDSVSCVYSKERMASQEEFVPSPVIHKEKKKGIFGSVIKDITGSKEKHVPVIETENSKESIQELSVIFSNANFPSDDDNNNLGVDEDELELHIDDIDLEDHEEKRKEQNILGALNKKKLAGTFQALKGRLKEMKGHNQKTPGKEEQPDEKGGAIDQIKKKYGFPSSNETSTAKLAESKLQEHIRKLEGINLRATEMQDTAKSFSSLAKQVLRTAEQDKRS